MLYDDWDTRYLEIVNEFRYSILDDINSAIYLDTILKEPNLTKISNIIRDKIVAVIGAGPSLKRAIPTIKQIDMIIIAADSAVAPLAANNIIPDIIVTDLDGDESALLSFADTDCIFVVHAHGDNRSKLDLVKNFVNCIGTTQAEPFKKIQNFGGFTDGDRAVFLAEHFGAKQIVLFGMDLGRNIGRYSNTSEMERVIKLQKLAKAKELLEWLGSFTRSELYTTSTPITGFKKIPLTMIHKLH